MRSPSSRGKSRSGRAETLASARPGLPPVRLPPVAPPPEGLPPVGLPLTGLHQRDCHWPPAHLLNFRRPP